MVSRLSICALWVTYLFYSSSLFANMTSSTKLEVHNVSQCCMRRTKPKLEKVKCIKYWVKFGHLVFEICMWTCRQTCIDRQNLTTLINTLAGSGITAAAYIALYILQCTSVFIFLNFYKQPIYFIINVGQNFHQKVKDKTTCVLITWIAPKIDLYLIEHH